MAWLLQNYFLPLLNPVSKNPPILTPVRPLAPLLKLYKNTMKIVTRDLSLMTQHKPKLGIILRDLEKWIAESRVAANVSMGETRWQTNHWPEDDETSEGNLKELWALEQLCKTLAEKGMLVPLSKKFELLLSVL
jgi:ribosomal biogenesis protein LAS1